jgi:hypothetical protein
MIHYQLRCSRGHEFDGWFKDSAAFESQVAAKLVDCPQCGDQSVARALMAPAVASGRERGEKLLMPPRAEAPAPPAGASVPPGKAIPAQVLAMLQRMRAEIERTCDYVGPRFAEEARRIHRQEAPARGIYGEASAEEVELLSEEGIEVARIPWVPRADS